MCRSQILATILSVLILLIAPVTDCTADVLANIPRDALGFVVIKDIGATNTKVEQLLQTLQFEFHAPLAFLKQATGVGDGLETGGDMLIAMLPGASAADRPQLAIWLPVSNYDRLISALDGTSNGEITAVSVAGEDLLVAHRGEWALVMDPEQRDRLEKALSAPSAPPPQVARWNEWILSQDVTVAVLPSGLQAALAWAATDRPEDIAAMPPSEESADDLFGPTAENDDDLFGSPDGAAPDTGDVWTMLRHQIRKQLIAAPQIARWAAEAEAAAVGVRIDGEGNAVGGLRLAWQKDWPLSTTTHAPAGLPADPPTLRESGEYMISGSGKLPESVLVAAAGAYARLRADNLRNDIQVQMDDEAIRRFQHAVERAAAEVTAVSLLTLPGNKHDGIYSNEFLAVRVRAAGEFVERASEVLQQWNEMNKSEQDESRLIFEDEKVAVGDRAAIQYSLDMAQAFGAAAVPEVRPSMERLFGPGGKLRLLIMPVDEHTALVAAATPEQASPVLDVLTEGKPIAWDNRAAQLLPQRAEWRLMASPHQRTRWLKRQMDAILGPVIGGPIVREFPPSPPIGAAGGFRSHEFWTDVAIPADTIRAAGKYLHQR